MAGSKKALQQALFGDFGTHALLEYQISAKTLRVILAPWSDLTRQVSATFSGAKIKYIEATSVQQDEEADFTPPWDVIRFDSTAIGDGMFHFGLCCAEVVIGFDAPWPQIAFNSHAQSSKAKSGLLIRSAVEDDLSQWSQMRTQLWPDTDDNHLSELHQFYQGTSIDIERCFVATLDGKCVGFLELNLRQFAEGSRLSPVPYVEGWFVKNAYRGQGIGAALMQHAERWATARGFSELASDTELDNHYSVRQHLKLGFEQTEEVVCFLKKLK